jgi:hypothetical protein
MRRLQIPRTLSVGTVVTLIAICALGIAAQSGRRARKPERAPAPTAEPTPSPTPTPTAKPDPKFTFILGLDKYGDFSRVSLSTYSGVLRSFADRLDDSWLVKTEISSSDMSWGNAVRRAKAEKEAYVVWIQVRSASFGSASEINGDPNNVYIEYKVLEPTTAKQVTSGSTFPEAYRKGPRIPNSPSSGDYYLNQAARGAAERILDHFHIHPSVRIPK